MQFTTDLISKSRKEISLLIEESSQNPVGTILEVHGGFAYNKERVALENRQLIDLCQKKSINYIAIDLSPVLLIGSSLGGLVTLNAASYSPEILGIILNCPAIHAAECIRNLMDPAQFASWRERGIAEVAGVSMKYAIYEDLVALDAMKIIGKSTMPMLIFHGTADTTVSIEQSREAKNLNPNIELVEIKDGGHRFGDTMQLGEWEKRVEEFIETIYTPVPGY
ncbi:MAG: prolyl oligopeptidase family serine peptidase [bacterium]|nr:prolyl oligopeptidase family serine peptidase [bacterium]